MLKGLFQKKNFKKNINMNKMAITPYLLIITLNVNGLYAPTKKLKVAECIRIQEPYIGVGRRSCCNTNKQYNN